MPGPKKKDSPASQAIGEPTRKERMVAALGVIDDLLKTLGPALVAPAGDKSKFLAKQHAWFTAHRELVSIATEMD